MPQNTTSTALLRRIGQAALSEFDRDDLYIAEPPLGLVLGEAHLELLRKLEEDRLDDPASVARLVELSRLVDTIQPGKGRLVPPEEAQGFVSDIFVRIVKNVRFSTVPLTSQQSAEYKTALASLYEEPVEEKVVKKAAYADFCLLRAHVEKKELALLELKQQLAADGRPEEKVALETEIGLLNEILKQQQKSLEALDRAGSLTEAERIIAASERQMDELPSSVQLALSDLNLLLIKEPISGASHVGCSFFPSSLSEDNWAPLKLTQADLRSAADPQSAEANDIDLDSIESIEFDMQALMVERWWFWPALFENTKWSWENPSLPISTGAAAPNGGALLPAYVYALIFARNLRVKQRPAMDRPEILLDKVALDSKTLLMRALVTPVIDAGAGPAPTSGVVFQPPALPSATLMAQPLIMQPQARITALVEQPDLRRTALVASIARRELIPMIHARPATGAIVHRGVVVAPPPPALSVVEARPRGLPLQNLVVTRALMGGGRLPNLSDFMVKLRFTASGSVQNEHSQPVAGARIALAGDNGQSTSSGTDGSFSLAELPTGRHPVVVSRPGFVTAHGVLTVPQSEPTIIRLTTRGDCQVTIEFVTANESGSLEPFIGHAEVVVETREGRRIEAVTNRSSAVLNLPAGPIALSMTAPEALSIQPNPQSFELEPNDHRIARFEVTTAQTLQNPVVQLLAFVCRRVPESPQQH